MHALDIPVQFWSIIWVTIFVSIFSFWAHKKIVKSYNNDKIPSKFVIVLEMYVQGFDNLMDSITGGKLRKAYPYFFTLFNFILFNTFISLFGWEPAPSSFMFTLTLGIITFLGIYIIGIGTYGFFKFLKEKYKNPIEIFTQFSPLLSISVRLFAATLAAAVIGEIFSIILVSLYPEAIISSAFPIFGVLFGWTWTLVDSFLGLVQAFVFVVLTAIYWSMEYGPSWNKSERIKYYRAEKDVKRQLKKEKKQRKKI